MTLQNHMLANFKPKKAAKLKQKKTPADKRKKLEGNSERHLAAIRLCPCVIPGCNKIGNSDPHHLKTTGLRGMAMRSPDRLTVPLCRIHHEEVESIGSKNELKWFEDRNIEALELADALWMVSPDKPAMFRIILAHKDIKR